MRKHLSVFMLMVRSCVYKLLLILLAMAAAEAAIFALMPNMGERLFFELVDSGRLFFVFVAANTLLQAALLGICTSATSKPRYTLARLSVSEKTVMYWHWLCGALAFVVLWLWQMIILCALARWHQSLASSDVVSHQSIYLSAFRSSFIHSVLPLEDISRFARNLVMAICSGGIAAAAAFKLRRGKKAGFGPAFISALSAAFFRAEHFEISYDGFVMFAFAFVLTISLVGVYTGDEEVDYEEASLEN